jgi:hypothetical protein
MRLVSVKGLIVALALAAQALVALHGFAVSGVLAAERDGAAPMCEPSRRHVERLPGPAQDRDGTACLSCQICLGGYSPLPAHLAVAHFAGPRAASLVLWPAFAHAGAGSTVARSHRARAPPVPA